MYCKHGCRHCAIKIQASKLAILFCWREKTIDSSDVFLNNELYQTPTTVFHQSEFYWCLWWKCCQTKITITNQNTESSHRISNFIIDTARIEEKFYTMVRIAKSKML